MTHIKRFTGVTALQVHQAVRRQCLPPTMATADAFDLLRSWMGYDVTRRRMDYAIERNLFIPPQGDGLRYQWTRADVVNLALALESMRAWLPGWHEGKKTAFELDAEAEQVKDLPRLEAAGMPELLGALVEAQDQLRIYALTGLICAKLPEDAPDEVYHLLGAMHRADHVAPKCALAATIRLMTTKEAQAHAG